MIPFNAVVLETFLTQAPKPLPLSRSLIYVIYSWESRRRASLVVYLALVTVINHSLANYIRSLLLLAMEPVSRLYLIKLHTQARIGPSVNFEIYHGIRDN